MSVTQQSINVKIRPDGKLWVSSNGDSGYADKARKCLESGFLYSVRFDLQGFDHLMEKNGIPPEVRKMFVTNIQIDDDMYFYPG